MELLDKMYYYYCSDYNASNFFNQSLNLDIYQHKKYKQTNNFICNLK